MDSEEICIPHKFLQHYKRTEPAPANENSKISILTRINYSAKSDTKPQITKEKLCQYLGLNRKQSNNEPVVSNINKGKDKLKRRSLRVRYQEIVKKTKSDKSESSTSSVELVSLSPPAQINLLKTDKKPEPKRKLAMQKFTGIERIDYCKKTSIKDNVIDLDMAKKVIITPQYEKKILGKVLTKHEKSSNTRTMRKYEGNSDKEVPAKLRMLNVPENKTPENLLIQSNSIEPNETNSHKMEEIMKFPRRLDTQNPPKLILIPRPRSRPLNMVIAQSSAVQHSLALASSNPPQLPQIRRIQGIVKPNLIRCSNAEEILMKQKFHILQEKLQETKTREQEIATQKSPVAIQHQPKEPPANINKINNKINIIIKMDPQDKRRLKFNQLRSRKKDPTPQKSPQKHVKTQTEPLLHLPEPEKKPDKLIKTENLDLITNCSTNNFLSSEAVHKIFFEFDILVVVQKTLISYFRYDKMKFLLTGVTIFNPIDKLERKLYDEEVDVDSNERLCFSENNAQNPILIEMRGKQKVMEPNMCPLLSLYCNIYYLDQDKLLFSCVHLDTVKSLLRDIIYITIPNSCYFLMSWSEPGLEKPPSTGLCKYNLTPNLQLAKLASIRQFPTIHYIVKHMNIANSFKLVVLGETELSIFNYNTGDLLISLDFGKNYGLNLTTFELGQNYLFMVKIANTDSNQEKDIHVTFIGGHSTHLKLIHSQRVQMGDFKTVTSTSICQKQLICTFDSKTSLILNLENFNDINIRVIPNKDRIFSCSNNCLVVVRDRNIQLVNSQFYINGVN